MQLLDYMLQLCEQRRIFSFDEWQQTCVEQRAVQVKDNTSNQLLCNRHFLGTISYAAQSKDQKQPGSLSGSEDRSPSRVTHSQSPFAHGCRPRSLTVAVAVRFRLGGGRARAPCFSLHIRVSFEVKPLPNKTPSHRVIKVKTSKGYFNCYSKRLTFIVT